MKERNGITLKLRAGLFDEGKERFLTLGAGARPGNQHKRVDT